MKVGIAVCINGAGSVCWAVDHHCWLSGAWLAIFRVGVAIWVLTMVQVDGLGVVVNLLMLVGWGKMFHQCVSVYLCIRDIGGSCY